MSNLAENCLLTDGDLFENAFHHAAIGMALVGLKGEFLKVNRSLCELVGYPKEELDKMTFLQITHPDDLDSDLKLMARLETGEISSCRLEKRYYTKTGAIVWILLTASNVPGPDRRPRFYISQIEDITARKEAEEALRRTLREKEELVTELQKSNSMIADLRSTLLTICAWTKRVRCRDRWMTVDEFLVNELGLNLTHGMSTEAEEQFMKGDRELNE